MDYGAFRNYIDNEPDLGRQPSLDAPRQPRWNGPVSSGGYLGHQGAQRKRLLRLDFGSRYRQRWHVARWKHRRSLREDDPRIGRRILVSAASMRIRRRIRPRRRRVLRMPKATTIRATSCRKRRRSSSRRRRRSSWTRTTPVAAVAQREVEPQRQHADAVRRQQGRDASQRAGSSRLAARRSQHDEGQLPADHGSR